MENVNIIRFDTNASDFITAFENLKEQAFSIIKNAIKVYYGDEYQMERIREGCILYLAEVDKQIVGVSYVKSNRRRGITAIHPETYRRMGIAEYLIVESFKDFPKQYSILKYENKKMLALLGKIGFCTAKSIEEIKMVVGNEEFGLLHDFQLLDDAVLFNRESTRRNEGREQLTLLYIGF